ncbi:MAG: transcription-repair coupling factor [Prevotella sp.]|nr:transcription-repair coupling factor [Prevotella sp.]
MKIQDLLRLYTASPQVGALAETLGKKSVKTVFLEGLMCSSAPMVFASLSLTLRGRLFLFILQDADEAGYFYHDLVQLMGEGGVLFLPSSYRRAIKYGQRDAANEILRTEVLSKLSAVNGSKLTANSLFIVTYPEAVAELVISKRQLDERMLLLRQGDTIDVDATTDMLRQLGFHEVDYVYEPGQFALRGSILDVYSYSSELPFRIDFFGDDIDSIRTFEVDTQLSKDKREQVEIVPELAVAEEKVPFLSFLPDDSLIVAKDFVYIHDAVDRIYEEGFSQQALKERLEGATEQEQRDIMMEMNKETLLISGQQLSAELQRFRHIRLTHGASQGREVADVSDAKLSFHTAPQPQFHKNFDLLQQSLSQSMADGYRLCILADSPKQLERLKDIFSGEGQEARGAKIDFSRRECGIAFNPIERTLHEGYVDHDLKLCVFTDHQIFDRFHKYNLRSDKARSGKVALTLKEIQQFEIGDYVVHIDHGIGKFGGLVRMPQGTGYQEMIKIQYDGGGTIYVSIHSLYKVSKYKAQDGGEPPRLSHLGTGQWERMKERTKQKLKDIARDLIRLYAARRQQKGYAFSPDSFMQHELEASFLYEDTPDQLKATNDVKADMEKSQPMDRLVCGDVGFGKTEVAVRAAFKAACDSKQVAVLVPTTVLAYQHYQTFSSRLKNLPVRVEYLSRARSTKQTTAILKDLADGKIDILIGTHKLIGKSVKFKDLGLLIIDEEQKFGVSTKEKLRQMKTSVDTLTMSATPIPRTLQFSLVGARDLSIIQTPPPNRYPVQTEIHTFGADIIADAINFEMSRNGQVFFVNPRINDLQRIRDLIQKYVPDARIAVGHGQMKPEELEQIIFDFQNYDYDVLLSTTIIENGIDIPNANTIIINGAHHFGLSDLHQMRGRVGRGNRKAFCYLLAPPLAALPVEGRRRLEALENFSDLGSGIHIAMQDLDIRGAGNLLGAEQSGFIADLGYETYVKILNQAVVELKNESSSPSPSKERGSLDGSKTSSSWKGLGDTSDFVSDCSLESDLEMYFPDQYVPSDSERMLLYRELDGLQTDEQLAAYRTRLTDRFGPVPHAGEELMRVVPLRRLGKRLGCERIMLKQGRMALYFVSQKDSPYYQSEAFDRILTFVAQHARQCNFREQNGKRSMTIANVPTVEAAVQLLSQI